MSKRYFSLTLRLSEDELNMIDAWIHSQQDFETRSLKPYGVVKHLWNRSEAVRCMIVSQYHSILSEDENSDYLAKCDDVGLL